MSWGPELTEAEQATMVTRQAAMSAQAQVLASAVTKMEAILATQQSEMLADRKVYDWLHAVAKHYEDEYKHLFGYERAGDFSEADLLAAADGSVTSKMFPSGYTELNPDTSIDDLNIIPSNLDVYTYNVEQNLMSVLAALIAAVVSGSIDRTNASTTVPPITTTAALTAASASITVSAITGFALNRWCVLSDIKLDILGSAADGVTAVGGGLNNRFTSATATFVTHGVVAGDMLYITSGANAGYYTVDTVVAENEILVTGYFGTLAGGQSYQIGPMLGCQYGVFLSGLPAALTLPVTVGTITLNTTQVDTGAIISSSYDSFREAINTIIGIMIASLSEQEKALAANNDDASSDFARQEIITELAAVRALAAIYTTWQALGDVTTLSNTDGACNAGAPYTLTSASGFSAAGVQIGDSLVIDGRVKCSGVDGETVSLGGVSPGDYFLSATGDFGVNDVDTGDVLTIFTGADAGTYVIDNRASAIKLRVGGKGLIWPAPLGTTGVGWQVTSGNEGRYSIIAVGANTVTVKDVWKRKNSTGEVFSVVTPAAWVVGALTLLRDAIASRIPQIGDRRAAVERAAVGIYNRRAEWLNALVNRATGSLTQYQSTVVSLAAMEDQQQGAEDVADTYGGILP
jgi:hypothetical protein